MDNSADEIADSVLKEFEKWPKKRKPLVRSDGVKEWVPLSGIVAQGSSPKFEMSADHEADIRIPRQGMEISLAYLPRMCSLFFAICEVRSCAYNLTALG
jgi:hypothetical protein